MTKHGHGNTRHEDISFDGDTLALALWHLSLVLQEIAADRSGQPDDRERQQENQEEKDV